MQSAFMHVSCLYTHEFIGRPDAVRWVHRSRVLIRFVRLDVTDATTIHTAKGITEKAL